jgi:4-hydroxy-tetrahydrodipicolinate synthase
MTSAMFPDRIRPIVTNYLAGDTGAALEQWTRCLPLINHENRQCGLRATKTVFREGGVIRSDAVRHPLKPLSDRTKSRLLELARDLDVLALTWGR